MGQLDNTKKAIGVNKIDEKDRQEIFKKFVDAGGQVIKEEESKKEESKTKSVNQKSSNQKSPISRDRKGNSSATSNRTRKDNPNNQGKENKDTEKNTIHEKDYSSFFDRFILKFKCWSSKVSPFGDPEVLPEFMSFLNLELKESFLNLSIASKEFLGNSQTSQIVMAELVKLNPIYPELILRGGKLINYGEMEELFRQYNQNPNLRVPVSSIYPPLFAIFRKLYFLYPYQNLYKKALEAGYEILEKIEKKSSVLYKTKKKQITKNHYFIFERAFDKIYLAVLRNLNKNIPLESKYFELILDVKPEDRIGSMRNLIYVDPAVEGNIEKPKEESPEKENIDEEKKEEVKEEEPPLIKHGKELIDALSPETLRKKYDSKKEFSDISISDKALLCYLYYKEFDSEYSQVLTSKKIVINTTNHAGLRTDHREKLEAVFELSRNCYSHFQNYLENREEYDKIKQIPLANYIEQSKKLSAADIKRNTSSRNTRSSIRDLMTKTAMQLHLLLDDMEKEKVIVGNPDEILTFDNVDSKKMLNKKKVKEAIYECCAYVMGVMDKMSDGGSLYGAGLEMTPEEMQKEFGMEIIGLTSEAAEKAEKNNENTLSDIS